MRSFLPLVLLAACSSSSSPAAKPAPAPAAPAPAESSDLAKARADLVAPITITLCGDVTASIDATAVTLKGNNIDARVPRTAAGAVDLAGMKAALGDCTGGTARVGATDDATYSDLVEVMDTLVGQDIRDVGLATPDLGLAKQPALPGLDPEDDLAAGVKTAPLLIIKPDAITFTGAITSPEPLADKPVVDDALARTLYKTLVDFHAHNPTASGVLIVQADRRVPALAVYRATAAAEAAGFGNVLFAVKK